MVVGRKITDDGLVAEFRSALQAVRAATQMQGTRPRMASESADSTENKDAPEEKGKGGGNNKRASAAALIDAFSNQYAADRKENKSQETHRIFREWLTIIGLFLAAGVAFLQWRVLHSTDERIRESYAVVQRPFITAREVIIDPNMIPGYWMFGVRFENSGSTPTSEMEFITVADQNSPSDPEEAFQNPSPLVSKFPGLLGPKAQDIPIGSQSGILVKTAEEMAKSRTNYNIRGVVHYRDLFRDSDEHVTKFCFAVIPYLERNELKSGVQRCLYWNCADDECTKDRKRFDAAVIAANPPKGIK
jgi:hypothetical protein